MFAVAVLLPGLIIGAIAWGVVGVLRQRGREEFTQATAAAFYAQVVIVAGILATLAGAGVLLKLGFSLIDPAYSYSAPPAGAYAYPSVDDQRAQDLILAAMLVGIGVLVTAGHWFLARAIAPLPGGSPVWVVRGTLVATTVLTGLVGFASAVVAGYQVLTYFIVGGQQNGPFGETAGVALIFVPAWAVAMTLLMRRLRGGRPRREAAMTAA
ncbi:MAG TPA: hypothetical protein VLW53_08370 [Candidatus Eisenbacteria bacterium]|nr:hypothetical protein [Candidatus Eisenbacteria bacterium]